MIRTLERDGLVWVDVKDPSAEELQQLRDRFGFHPLALEDCAHFDQRTKLEEFEDHLFIVVHGLLDDSADEILDEMHFFLGASYLVTVHRKFSVAVDQLWQGLEREIRDGAGKRGQLRGPDFLLHRVLDRMMDQAPVALSSIEEKLEELEDEAVLEPSARRLAEIHDLRKRMSRLRRTLYPQGDLYRAMAQGNYALIGREAQHYFRDVYDHSQRVIEHINELRERVNSVAEMVQAGINLRANETMKRLAVFSALFLPLTFVTGFFGMNFEHMPWGSDSVFWASIVFMLALPVAILVWFRRRGWIR